ncbi:MAG: FIVAR domain-containing protein [Clostridiales bacterium]|nr:FIVAR domain-containing protein [Clostridiales bacterium]
MKAYTQTRGKGSRKILAVTMAILLTLTTVGLILGNTFAAPGDVQVTLQSTSGISGAYTIEAGQTGSLTVVNLNEARSSDTTIATLTHTPGMLGNITITGVKAGITTIAYGNRLGVVAAARYQITDSNNISAYILKNGGEVHLHKPGDTAQSPVEVTAGTNNIQWRSLNQAVASVDEGTGAITAVTKGAAIVLGQFIDKWGVDRDVHILVEVGVRLSDNDLAELIDLINKGKEILEKDPNLYTDESLGALDDAVNKGEGVVNKDNPSEEEIKDAIDDLKDAIKNLVEKEESALILGKDGNYYRPLHRPKNVYEIVDQDGKGKQPPEYVYNTGEPGDGNDIPAVTDGNGNFYIEEPENIWTPITDDGDLDEDNKIWGGADGEPGGGDDQDVTEFEDGYWVHMGQNVWRKYSDSNPKGPLGPLTGGGPDGNPATDPVTDIYDHTANDGKYYVGPLGPDEDGNEYYYGDPASGGNGTLDSTADGAEKDDVKYYRNEDGTMTTTKPVKPIVDEPTGTDDGRLLNPADTGDTVDWLEIARNGEYSLIIRTDFININGNSYGVPGMQGPPYGGNNDYIGSIPQESINDWFNGYGLGDNLDADARLREHTSSSNAFNILGTSCRDNGGLTSGFSKPSGQIQSYGNDIAFALSFGEAANFLSREYATTTSGGLYEASSTLAANNFNKLTSHGLMYSIWLRSPGVSDGTAAAISDTVGRVFQNNINTGALLYPALWVHNSIFK